MHFRHQVTIAFIEAGVVSGMWSPHRPPEFTRYRSLKLYATHTWHTLQRIWISSCCVSLLVVAYSCSHVSKEFSLSLSLSCLISSYRDCWPELPGGEYYNIEQSSMVYMPWFWWAAYLYSRISVAEHHSVSLIIVCVAKSAVGKQYKVWRCRWLWYFFWASYSLKTERCTHYKLHMITTYMYM
jgi:hypothetical protein